MRILFISLISLWYTVAFANNGPKEFKFLSSPEYYEGEGMRGYEAKILVSGTPYTMNVVCEYYDPPYPAFDVTWWTSNTEYVEYNLDDGTHHLIDSPASYNRVPFEFYQWTCGKLFKNR